MRLALRGNERTSRLQQWSLKLQAHHVVVSPGCSGQTTLYSFVPLYYLCSTLSRYIKHIQGVIRGKRKENSSTVKWTKPTSGSKKRTPKAQIKITMAKALPKRMVWPRCLRAVQPCSQLTSVGKEFQVCAAGRDLSCPPPCPGSSSEASADHELGRNLA